MSISRSGILAGGNWIIDHVKIVDVYPEQDALANILEESSSNGGSPYNILIDLARLGAKFPLEGVGLLGRDSYGEIILKNCKHHKISTKQLQMQEGIPTSYTDVMTVKSTGRRTFFHQRGANALLNPSHFVFSKTKAKIFHLGYLLLLDSLDAPSKSHGTKAGEVLAKAQRAGLKTSVDVVSEDSRRFTSIVLPTLKYVDFLILNEFEAERITGVPLRKKSKLITNNLKKAAQKLLKAGVREWVVIHYPEGSLALGHGECLSQGNVSFPRSKIAGTAGAGDAFAAGLLFSLHENIPMAEGLRYASCVAAASLAHPTCSLGVQSLEKCIKLGKKYGYR